ncbi:hypothetical protein E4H04_11650 [Candidatus Bathyarchaeota archaeon]|nr:MAG: hypothetical protein E4H04_11650 [Candidatus Bathyarchaeota archaeon]
MRSPRSNLISEFLFTPLIVCFQVCGITLIVDEYLDEVEEPQMATTEKLRKQAKPILDGYEKAEGLAFNRHKHNYSLYVNEVKIKVQASAR